MVLEEDASGSFDKWFQYSVGFLDNCIDKTLFGEACAIAQMKKAGINHEKVSKCVQESFVRGKLGDITDNKILAEDAQLASMMGIFLHPSVSINNITYRGDLNGMDIFRAVCVGFSDAPDICKGNNVLKSFDQYEQEAATVSVHHKSRGNKIKGYHILIAIVAVMLINFGALYLYRRYHRQKVN